MNLTETNKNQKVKVKKIECSQSIKNRLRALGMTENTIIDVLHKKHNGTCVINLRGTRFALGSLIGEKIEVETYE